MAFARTSISNTVCWTVREPSRDCRIVDWRSQTLNIAIPPQYYAYVGVFSPAC